MKRLALLALFFLTVGVVDGVCQGSNFFVQDTACKEQNLILNNTSTFQQSYLWDFCLRDLEQVNGVNSVVQIPSSSVTTSAKVVFDRGNWYGFITNRGNGKLIRLDFGADINSTPIVNDLGNFGGLLTVPEYIDFLQEGNSWYGLVMNYGNDNRMIRLNFANGLSQPPLVDDLSNFAAFSSPRGIDIIEDGNNKVAIVSSCGSDKITLVNFGNSISNPVQSFLNIGVGNALISCPIGVALFNESGNWYGLVASYLGNKILKLDFGTSLFSQPIISSLADIQNPTGVSIVKEGGKIHVYLINEGGQLHYLDFGATITNNPVITNLGNFGLLNSTYSLDLVKAPPTWKGFAFNLTSQVLFRINFNQAICNEVNQLTSTNTMPKNVFYSKAGKYEIELTAYTSTGDRAISKKSIVVMDKVAPLFDFAADGSCVNNNVNFSSSQPGIINYDWNFNDLATSTSSSPVYVFSATGQFPVSLTASFSNQCSRTVSKIVGIYSPPQASFSLPSISPLCTNQSLVFNNTTPSIGTAIGWQWSVNGTNVSTAQNLSSSFSSTGSQTINLQASIPGCSSVFSQTINSLTEGSLANFTAPSASCLQGSVSFSNTTIGSVTSYQWTFGDGNTSTSTNASNTYANIGTYQVTLQASNAAGCQNTATKSITIYSKPQPDFSIGLPPFSCAGSPSQFTDQTPAPTDSNIAAWQWAFGDPASGTSTTRNPTYTYSTAGTYNVSLAATTNFGCTGSIQKAVTISASPQAAFTNSVACVSQPTQFTDASSGSIRSRLWTIQGNSFTTPNVQFAFVTSGSYPVLLTVTGTNNCTSQAVKNIVVPVLPTLDFSVQAACNTNPTLFSEITTGADAPLSQTWNFASLGTGTGATTQFTFSTPGNYAVQLRSTRQSGCVYSITKNVSVTQGPVADFTPSVDVGGPPLSVNFVNTSTGASSYLWRFGNSANTTSTVVSPNFTFNELGVYAVKLTASNTAGCSFTTSKPITVLVPNINVMLSDFRATPDGSGILQPTVSIVNSGNLPVSNPDLLIDVASAGLVRKKLNARILPNQTMSVPVDLQIVARSAGYICAELVVPNNTADFDKRRCLPLGSDEILFAPYPNPAADILNFDWVSTQARPVSVIVFSPGGSEVFRQQVESIAAGLNRLQIKTTELPNGLYYILYSDGTTTKSFSFAVAKN